MPSILIVAHAPSSILCFSCNAAPASPAYGLRVLYCCARFVILSCSVTGNRLPCVTGTVIESITSNRDPQPQFEAMYLLMSTSQNVDRVIGDFSNGQQQYAAAHLFFIDGTFLYILWAPRTCQRVATCAFWALGRTAMANGE